MPESTFDVPTRKYPIKEAEWLVTIQLQVKGENVGAASELRFADSYISKNAKSMGYLIGKFVQERAVQLKPAARKKSK